MTHSLRFVLASDHAGVRLKDALRLYLEEEGYPCLDRGMEEDDEASSYVEQADIGVLTLMADQADVAILVCGSGQGMAMRANRYVGIRAALIHTPEMAKLARLHNNANVLCFGERVTDVTTALAALEAYLAETFEGGRHAARVEQLDASPTVNLPAQGGCCGGGCGSSCDDGNDEEEPLNTVEDERPCCGGGCCN